MGRGLGCGVIDSSIWLTGYGSRKFERQIMRGRRKALESRNQQADEPVRRYRAFGLRIASGIDLPELTPDHDRSAPADVEIAFGDAGVSPSGATRIDPAFAVAPRDCLIEFAGVARYRIRDGASVVVEPARDAAERRVRLNLLGAAFGVICHQRGILPLHASVVEIDGRCAAFLGRSGAGKSTMAAALQARGARLLGDDICAIHMPAGDRAFVWPGVAFLKLWDDSAQALGYGDRPENLPRSLKLHFAATAEAPAMDPRRLDGLYVLAEAVGATEAAPEAMPSADALNALLTNTFRPTVMAAMGLRATNLMQCSELLRRCGVFAFRRNADLTRAERSAERIEEHLRHIGIESSQGIAR